MTAGHALRRRLVFLVVFTIAVLAAAQAAHAHGRDEQASNHAGNPGSVKVDDDAIDDGPANHPHVVCALRVVVEHGFGRPFDIDFDAQAPTTKAGDDQRFFVVQVPEGDNVSGLIDLRVALASAGINPQPPQGFHIFITVHLPGGDKHKAIWLQLCPPETTTTTAGGTTTTTAEAATTTTSTTVFAGAVTNNSIPTQVLGENFVKTPGADAAGASSLANTGNPFSPALAVGLVLSGLMVLGWARHISGRRLEASMRRVVDRER